MKFKKIVTFLCLFILFCSPPSHSEQKEGKWQILHQHPIYVVCVEKDVNNGKSIIGFAHKEFLKISSDLGFVTKKKIYIVIAPTVNYFHQITGGNLPEWSGGAAIPSQATILLKSPRITNPDVDLKKIVVHELAHIGLYLATGGQNIMKWFEEGFAQYYSGELNMNVKILMAQRLLTGNFLSFKEIDDVFNLRESEASLAYGEALAAVSYLIETGGWEAFKIFIQNLKQRGNMELAMQAALGMGLDEFEAEWIATMKRRYLWLVIFDYRLIISILFIVLFLSAYLIKIKNTRKIKQNWEKEDIEIYQAHEENTLDQENSIQN
jgi:hypothetical protein